MVRNLRYWKQGIVVPSSLGSVILFAIFGTINGQVNKCGICGGTIIGRSGRGNGRAGTILGLWKRFCFDGVGCRRLAWGRRVA